jgi:subtilisin family serine protease
MATPHVPGLAALILTRNPSLTPDGVRSVLQSQPLTIWEQAERDNTFGYGLINAQTALRSIAERVHLSLAIDPFQASYARGQLLTLTASVFNEMNPAFNSSLALTVTGPGGY